MTFWIDFILGFDDFEGVSGKSWVLTILKGSRTNLFCLWTDLADFFKTQSPLGDVNVRSDNPCETRSKILNLETPCLS